MPASEELVLRPAEPGDEKTIRNMVRRARINPTGIDWRRFVVIESPEGEVIACGQVKPHRDGTNELASMVVLRPWRGKGLARRIIEHLRAATPGDLYLMCGSHLGPFYEKFGFREVEDEDMPRYYRRVKALVRLPEQFSAMKLLVMVHHGEQVDG